MPAACVFCSIVATDAPAHIVFRDPMATGFLDTRPLFPGHTLIVPNDHHETLADLPTDQLGPLFARAQRVAAMFAGREGIAEALGSADGELPPRGVFPWGR